MRYRHVILFVYSHTKLNQTSAQPTSKHSRPLCRWHITVNVIHEETHLHHTHLLYGEFVNPHER